MTEHEFRLDTKVTANAVDVRGLRCHGWFPDPQSSDVQGLAQRFPSGSSEALPWAHTARQAAGNDS